jgi:outer membrane protein W
MKKLTYISLIALLVLSAPMLSAKNRIGIEGTFAVPSGEIRDYLGIGFGGGIFLERMFSSNIAGRIDLSYHYFSKEEHQTYQYKWETHGAVVPVRLGANYYFGQSGSTRFYAGLMAGAYFRTFTAEWRSDDPFDEEVVRFNDSESKTTFGFAPQIGVLIPLSGGESYIDLGVSYETWLGDEGFEDDKSSVSYVRIDAGISFGFTGDF